jgi:PAS domain S-box-containing protein
MSDLPSTPAAELLLRSLQQTREYAVIILDAQGKITGWLGAAERVFGYAAHEVTGNDCGMLFTPEDWEKGLDRQERDAAVASGRAFDDRWHLRKDGTAIWVTGTMESVWVQGRLAAFVKVCRDRSDLRAQLDSLSNQAAVAQTRLENVQAVVRTLGHELRNPLAPIQTAARIILDSEVPERVERAAQVVMRQAQTLQRIAEDLMDATRLETGAIRPRLALLDFRSLVEEGADSVRELAAKRRLRLELVQPQSPLRVHADAPRIHQVLLNLLSNALKYTPPGGTVWLKTTQEGSEVVLRVEDTGIGIAPDVLPKIFDLFTRDTAAVATDPAGLGIGLAMVRNIVRLHGGSVQARSGGRGKGSEFTVRLPAA